MTPLRVFLADDHPVVLAGVRALVESEPGLAVVGEATEGHIAVERATALRPDIAVIDMSLPGLNGAQVTEALARACPDCRCIALTVHEDRVYVRRMLEVGASGYVLKRSAPAELVRAIRAVARGGVYLDPAIAAQAIGRPARREAASGQPMRGEPTEREAEVLRLTASGHSNKAIALLLGLAVKTVEAHKAHGMEKLGLRSRVELLRHAVCHGWLAGG